MIKISNSYSFCTLMYTHACYEMCTPLGLVSNIYIAWIRGTFVCDNFHSLIVETMHEYLNLVLTWYSWGKLGGKGMVPWHVRGMPHDRQEARTRGYDWLKRPPNCHTTWSLRGGKMRWPWFLVFQTTMVFALEIHGIRESRTMAHNLCWV